MSDSEREQSWRDLVDIIEKAIFEKGPGLEAAIMAADQIVDYIQEHA